MLSATAAYHEYKRQTEQLLDFVVVVCYAAPHLARSISAEKGRPAAEVVGIPDHFSRHNALTDDLLSKVLHYPPQLASYVVLSSFSFFEAFVKEAVLEMLRWHGGAAGWKRRSERFITDLPADLRVHKRRLQETPRKGQSLKYRKHSQALNAAGYKYPSSLLSSYAAALLEERVSNESLRASEIPDLLIKGLHMRGADVNPGRFGEIRAKRNKIAHGKGGAIQLAAALRVAKDLHALAAKVDLHLREHFYVIEDYAAG